MTTLNDPTASAEILFSTSDGVEWEIEVQNPTEIPINAVTLERVWYQLQRKLHAINQAKLQEWQLAQSAKEITNA